MREDTGQDSYFIFDQDDTPVFGQIGVVHDLDQVEAWMAQDTAEGCTFMMRIDFALSPGLGKS
jgi:hypothetical protein